MLGWEYPPLYNGGLGVACAGLCEALSKHADIALVVPKIDRNVTQNGIKIFGLNQAQVLFEEASSIVSVLREKIDIHKIDVDLDPYLTAEEKEVFQKQTVPQQQRRKQKVTRKILPEFESAELYGSDIIRKVILYAELVVQLSKEIDFDIIHAHDWMTFLAGLEVKSYSGKPLVLHIHSLDYDRAGSESRGWIYDVEKRAMNMADIILPVSDYTGNIIASHYGINTAKLKTVHNGLGTVKTYRKLKQFPEKLVLFIGRLTGQKGPEYFLEAADKIHRQYNDVRFAVAGTGERLTRLLEDGAYRHLGNRVHFTGFLDRSRINDLLAIADVYCMPSVSEPFGLTALEAAQFGIPTVISQRSGAAEVLTGSLQADFWDIDLMAEHIISLLSDENIRNEVIESNYKDLERLTWHKAAENVAGVYEKLMQ